MKDTGYDIEFSQYFLCITLKVVNISDIVNGLHTPLKRRISSAYKKILELAKWQVGDSIHKLQYIITIC